MDRRKQTALRILREAIANSPLFGFDRYCGRQDLFEKQAVKYMSYHPEYDSSLACCDLSEELQLSYQFYVKYRQFDSQYRPVSDRYVLTQITFYAVLSNSKQTFIDFGPQPALSVLDQLVACFKDHLRQHLSRH